MINKLKFVGVLSISVLALGNSAFAESYGGLNPNQIALIKEAAAKERAAGNLDYESKIRRTIAQLPPVELPSDKFKPIGVLPPVTGDGEINPTNTIGIKKPIFSSLPAPVEGPIYGQYDPETGGVIVSHNPPISSTPLEGPTVYYADGYPGSIKDPTVSNYPTPVDEEVGEINPTNTINIKNLNPNQIAVMKEVIARERASGNLSYKIKRATPGTAKQASSEWKTQ